MKDILNKALQSGLIVGVILVFFELIDFTCTLGVMLEKLVSGSSKIKSVSPVYLGIMIALIVLLFSWQFARRYHIARQENGFLKGLLLALGIGLVSGGMLVLLNWTLSRFLTNKIDLRNYLAAMSPDVIKRSLFEKPFAEAIPIYFLTTSAGALSGVLIGYIGDKTGQPGQFFTLIAKRVRALKIANYFERNSHARVIGTVLIIIFALSLPLILNPYMISVVGLVLIYAILGLGLNLIVGLSGQLVFGYVAFYAVGAYTFALLTAPKPLGIEAGFIPAFLLALVSSGIIGALIGLPIMNLRGDYLAIVTLGFAEIVRILVNSNQLAEYTGGPQGIKNIGSPAQPKIISTLFGDPLPENIWFLYLILFLFVLVLYISFQLQFSRTGRSWEAMRDDETVAQACGVNTRSYKVLAIIIGAVIAGAAGAIYASRNTYIGPGEYGFMVSVNALSVVVVGGMGSIPGTLLGALIIKGMPEFLRDLDNYRMLVFGALLVIMMVLRPEGLLPVKRRKLSVKPESIDVLKEDLRP